MKKTLKLMFGIVIIASFLLTACAPPPPPVTKIQLDTAEEEAIKEEGKATELEMTKNDFETELSKAEANLENLQKYQQELMADE